MTSPVAWLLDTNIFSELMRTNPEPIVVEFLDRIAPDKIGLASVTVWEILNGIGRLKTGRRRNQLSVRFYELLDDAFDNRVFDWTFDDAVICAQIMEDRRRRGEPLDNHLPDAMIAGTARNRRLTIITRNESEFRNTGVKTVNPWQSLLH